MDSLGSDGFAVDSATDFVHICRRIAVGIEINTSLAMPQRIRSTMARYRRLEVKLNVKDVPDLRVHTRAGYYSIEQERGLQ